MRPRVADEEEARTIVAMTLPERQMRLIAAISSIDDADLLAHVQRIIDRYETGLRALEEGEMDAVLRDLRPEGDD